jgi:D-beta-D-heptose 7-phosphate kinase/D-beta-D-heptose 1-phosphate adenosyltransferase
MIAKNKNQVVKYMLDRRESEGIRIGFTNGCFDIVHFGHINLLRKCKEMCDVLIVGLNSDKSVRLLKGATRPINNFQTRSEILSEMLSVDLVIKFDEPTPTKLIELIKPNYIFKGSDYDKGEVAGSSFVESNGGKVILFDLVPNCSTTRTVKKIRGQE